MRIVKLTEETKKNILENLLKRSPNQYGAYEAAVNEIIENVRQKGDAALFEYTEKFDKARLTPETIQVKEEEIEKAYQLVDEKLLEVIRKALVNIRSAGTENHSDGPCGRLCSRWKGCLSVLRADECHAG